MTNSVDTLVDLRPLMAGFPTGVCVLTTMAADEHPWGMTCTSVCSVALSPPTLLACLRRGSPTLRAALDLGTFALNLLHAGAEETAVLFASGAPDRFTRVKWQMERGYAGPHLVEAAHTTADCSISDTNVVGDHIVLFSRVTRVTQRLMPEPLLYGLRRYARWPVEVDIDE